MVELIGALISASNGWLIYILAFLAGVMGVYFKGRSDGKTVEKQRIDELESKAKDISNEVDSEVSSRAPSENRERLSKWVR